MKLKKKEGGIVLFDSKRSEEFRRVMGEGLCEEMRPILKRMDQDRRRREKMFNPNEMIGLQVG